MSSDYEKRLEALCEQASNEKNPEKLKQLICKILIVLEAHQQHLPDRWAGSSDHPTTRLRRGRFRRGRADKLLSVNA